MFCAYCGDAASLDNEQIYCGNCVQTHIPRRNEALVGIKQYIQIQDHIFPIGINVNYLYPPSQNQPKRDRKITKDKRDRKLEELLTLVTALRNSNSGAVLVHLVGLEEDDSYLGAFDEFVDQGLNDIIHDGSLFTEAYKKQRLSAHENLKEFYDFLVLYVTGEPYLTTYKFNTKISLDFCHKDASEVNVRKLFKEERALEGSFHDLGVTVAQDLLQTTENNSLQFKSNFHSDKSDSEIVNILFGELKLARYVSAFSKNEHGGSFVFGLTEEDKHRTVYKSKTHKLQSLKRSQFNCLKPMIEERALETVLISGYGGNRLQLDNIVQVRFIPEEGYQNSCNADDLGVLQIAVRPVPGIVFFNREGPLAHIYDEESRSISKLSLEDWFHLFTVQEMDVD